MAKVEEMRALIKEQTKGKVGTPECGIGFQLMDIVGNDEHLADIVLTDIQAGKGLKEAAAELKKFADSHHGKSTSYCITPLVADGIIREFYGLPKKEILIGKDQEGAAKPGDFIDLDDFL